MTVAGEPVLVLAAAGPDAGRIEVGLVLASLDRTIDVTAHPAAARTALRDAARRHGRPEPEVEADARQRLHDAATGAGAWVAPRESSIEHALGGAGFPLLAAAYGAGARSLDEVPRWAVPILRQPSARAAAVQAFGRSATRPVVAAVGRRFTEPAPPPTPEADRQPQDPAVPLLSLALGLMGLDVLPSDRLARVVGQPVATCAGDHLPDRATIAAARRTLRRWGAARAERLLTEATTVAHGTKLLLDLVRYATDLGDHGPRRVAGHLAEAHDQFRSAMVTDPGPALRPPARPARRAAQQRHPAAHDPPARAPAPAAAPAPAPRRPDPRHRVYAPAAAPAQPRVDAATTLPRPARLAALHHQQVGDLRLVVPRTVGDLVRWSRILANCLHDYGPVAASGRSIIIGVERDGTLRYALELEASGRVRQFVGPANRPPPADDRLAVVTALIEHGLIDPRLTGNAVWLLP